MIINDAILSDSMQSIKGMTKKDYIIREPYQCDIISLSIMWGLVLQK